MMGTASRFVAWIGVAAVIAGNAQAAPRAEAELTAASTAPDDDMKMPSRLDSFDLRRPVPAGYRVVVKRSDKLLRTAAVCVSASYAATAAWGAHALWNGGTARDVWPVFVPAVGPFVTMANMDPKQPGADAAYFALGVAGAGQVVGFTMLAAGLVFQRPELVRSDKARFQAAPWLGRDAQGLGLSGTF